MKINKILIALLLIILTIGAVSASDNATVDDNTPQIEDEPVMDSNDTQAKQENMSSPETGTLNAHYVITVDEDYIKDSFYESTFNIYLPYIEYMGGNLEIFIDDELKYSAIPTIGSADLNYLLDEHFLDRLNLTLGTHKAEFKYSGDPIYKAFDETRYFNYTYLKFKFTESDEDHYWGFYVNFLDATGKLKIVIDNETKYDKKFKKYDSFIVRKLAMGVHTYDIYYSGDSKYPPLHRHGTFNMSYLFNPHFSYYESGKTTLEDNMLRIYLPKDAKSNITVFVNNKTYNTQLPNYGIMLTNLKTGENIINVTYEGDEKYPKRTEILNITVIPTLEFTYIHSSVLRTDGPIAKLTLSPDARGTLIVKIDNKVIKKNLKNGVAEISLSKVKPGLHNFQINYTGDYEKYFRNRTIKNIYIFEGGHINLYKDFVSLYIPESENGTLTLKINGKTETINVKEDYHHHLNLKEGIWSIKATYEGKKIILKESKTFDTTTQKYFHIMCEDYYLKDDLTKKATIYAKDSTSKKGITAYIDNKKVKMGKFGEIDLSKLKAGTHTLKVEYRNAKNAVLQSVKKKFTIAAYSNPTFTLKDKSSVELNRGSKIDLKVSNRLTLSDNTTLVMDLDLKGNVGGKVTVYKTFLDDYDSETGDPFTEMLVGKYKSFKINKGKARITIPTSIFKSFFGLRLSISLNDGNELEKSFVTIFKPKIVHPEKMIYGENRTLTIYTPECDNTTIGMFGDFKPVYSKIVNGKAEFPLSKLPIKDGMRVKFAYEDDKNGISAKRIIYDIKMNIKDPHEKVNILYSSGTVYSFDVSQIYGKTTKTGDKVKFKIGKTTINAKINKKGIAKLKIPNSIKPGKYSLTATYKGGKTVKKLTIKHIVSLKSVKVKKYAKKLVLQATLKKVNGKYLKGKKITFKFNGKTLKAKTNKKGVAKVTVPRYVLYQLWVGKKVTYSATFGKDTVKKTAKVKR